ncbi:MAG TPA: hypothetical protein VIG51_01000 [Candidatus Baltobacteraceae bacterium]
MSQLAEFGTREAILVELDAIEALCAGMERALMGQDWARMDGLVADSRRVTHALENAYAAAAPVRDELFDAEVLRRLRSVDAVRRNQMGRLQYFHDAVGDRLQLLGRAKNALRSLGKPKTPKSRLGSLDQLS